MKRVVFLFPTNRTRMREQVIKGIAPDTLLYGFNHLGKGFLAQEVTVSPRLERILNFLLLPLVLPFNTQFTHINIARVLLALHQLNNVDIVVTCVDSINRAACLLKRIGLLNSPLLCMAGNVLDGSEQSNFLHRWLWRGADKIITHSQIDQDKLSLLHLERIGVMIPVGSDKNFYIPEKIEPEKNLIVSVGADRDRDYKTLFAVVRKLPNLVFDVFTKPINIGHIVVPKNLKIHFNSSFIDTRKSLSKATAVVIPVNETYRASGQLALADAIQMEKLLIVSKVAGIREYGLKNRANALLVVPGDIKGLAKAIRSIVTEEKLKYQMIKGVALLRNKFTTKHYGEDLAKIINEVLSDDVKLCALEKCDLEFLRRLRNENRQYFLDHDYISISDQAKWFEGYKRKDDDRMVVFMNGKEKIGVGAIYHIDMKNKSAEIGRFAIDHKYQGRGYGNMLLKKIEQIASAELKLRELRLEVLADNKKAISLYEKNAFCKNGQKAIGNNNVVLMAKAI